MSPEPKSFLHGRASTEIERASRADSLPAAIAHAGLARLYILRCAASADEEEECRTCELGSDCAKLRDKNGSELVESRLLMSQLNVQRESQKQSNINSAKPQTMLHRAVPKP
jgi:hypothetical protein